MKLAFKVWGDVVNFVVEFLCSVFRFMLVMEKRLGCLAVGLLEGLRGSDDFFLEGKWED